MTQLDARPRAGDTVRGRASADGGDGGVRDKGLGGNSVGLMGSAVIGVSTVAPVYCLTSTLGSTAGTPLDPISLSVDTQGAPAEQPKPAPSKTKDEGAKKDEDEKEKDAEKAKDKEKAGRFEDAAVDWGVRRTFREYVTGSIGQGKWTLADGAQDGGALFRFR
ncbi:HtaA domain-containing protein, partial [Streptomyces halstedii]|uniref:HtaA domain-containing protein n=1 Tax=Streptomyces halstedii TaxID=1944 RepID=UPI0033B982B0